MFIIVLIPLAVLLILALALSASQRYLTRWLFKREIAWRPLFFITLAVGGGYLTLGTALATSLATYAPLILAPLGVALHAVLVTRLIPDANGNFLRFRQAIIGQALTILMFAAQQIPIYFNLLRGLS